MAIDQYLYILNIIKGDASVLQVKILTKIQFDGAVKFAIFINEDHPDESLIAICHD